MNGAILRMDKCTGKLVRGYFFFIISCAVMALITFVAIPTLSNTDNASFLKTAPYLSISRITQFVLAGSGAFMLYKVMIRKPGAIALFMKIYVLVGVLISLYAILSFIGLMYAICFLLDNCSIHNATMQAALLLLLSQVAMAQGVTITFMKTQKYSPNFNPAEYVIHLIRQRSLYNLPQDMSTGERAERIKLHLAQGPPPLLPEQVGSLLQHIYTLPVDKK